MSKPETYSLLSLDGGGCRGILQLQVLKHLEGLTGKPIRTLFSHLAGTSVGGILALAFACTDKSAVEIEAFFLQLLPHIFTPTGKGTLAALQGPRYPAQPLEKALLDFFKGASIYDAGPRLTIPVFDYDAFEPTTIGKRGAPALAWAAARATSAAPTYFPPFQGLLDGGLWANNPTGQALVESSFGGDLPTLVLSVGSGEPRKGRRASELASAGIIGWAQPLLDVFTDGSTRAVDRQVRATFAHRRAGNAYLRLQTTLPDDLVALDQSHPERIARLILHGQDMVRDRVTELARFAERLVD